MRTSVIAIALLAASLGATSFGSSPALAADTCHERSHQFGKMRHCVTSVRPPQGAASFGPEHLAATDDGAWCAGAENAGGAQSMTLYEDPAQLIRTITITTGFANSADTSRQSRRIKRAMIETDRGYKATVTLKDTAASQKIIIAKARIGWVRLTILDAYPGSTGICVSEFLANVEEFANN